MKAHTRMAAVAVMLVALAGCSGEAEPDDAPATAAPSATATDDPTEEPTQQIVDPDGEPLDESDVSYLFDEPELTEAETYAVVDLIWQSGSPEQQADLCEGRATEGEDVLYDELQNAIPDIAGDATVLNIPADSILLRSTVDDYFETACA